MTTSLANVTPLSARSGTFEVVGSQGNLYIVNQNCTCPGFRYRRRCRHLELVKEFQMAHQAQLEAGLQQKIQDLYR
jgi:hypothetical protein